MDSKALKTNFQRELLFSIILNMKMGSIAKPYAKKVAKSVLPVFKSATCDEFLERIEKLCKYSPEISDAFIKTARVYEQQTVDKRLKDVREHLVLPDYQMKGGE